MSSLKNQIKYYLEKNGYMSLLELENLCKSEQHKLSNGERRLRELTSPKHKDYDPNIKLQKNGMGAIIGYVYKQENAPPERLYTQTVKYFDQEKTCCYSAKIFKDKDGRPIHSPNCRIPTPTPEPKKINRQQILI